MNEQNNQPNKPTMGNHPEGCRCWMCQGRGMCAYHGGHLGGWGFRLFRVILLAILVAFVFAFGVKIGEFKAELGGYGGFRENSYSRMMIRGGYGGYGMMPQWGTAAPQTITPAPQGGTQAK